MPAPQATEAGPWPIARGSLPLVTFQTNQYTPYVVTSTSANGMNKTHVFRTTMTTNRINRTWTNAACFPKASSSF